MEMNVYWDDLSEEGKESLINSGFVPSEEHKKEMTPVGVLKI